MSPGDDDSVARWEDAVAVRDLDAPDGPERTAVLVTVTGPDFPGVNAELFTVLAEHDAAMLDVQQATIQSRIMLSALISMPAADADRLEAALQLTMPALASGP